MDVAVFGAGCFWCVEAIFSQLDGVQTVESGYCGGHVKNPTYQDICNGNTDHAEVCRIAFNPKTVSFEKLLIHFFKIHNPTTLNRQGNDIGTQYRSAIFYVNDEQKNTSNKLIKDLTKNNIFNNPIITEVTKLETFYIAEDYHQNYYKNNSNAPYCKAVIKPKINKFLDKSN